MFNQNENACNFGLGIGVLAFLACVIFLVLDAYLPQISNAKERNHIVTADLAFSGKCFNAFSCLLYIIWKAHHGVHCGTPYLSKGEIGILLAIKRRKPKKLCLSSPAHLRLFGAWQVSGRSCGLSASASWPTSGHTAPVT